MSFNYDPDTGEEWCVIDDEAEERAAAKRIRDRIAKEAADKAAAIEAERAAELHKIKSTIIPTDALKMEIAERVSASELLLDICDDPRMPTVRRIQQWLRHDSAFFALYRESINDRLMLFEEQVLRIADDARHDFRDVKRGNQMVRVVDGDAIARAKLRVEVRFRHLKAYKPSLWGETSTLNLKTDPMAPDLEAMTIDEVNRKIFELEEKDRDPKPAPAAASRAA